ncbi:tripartite motif-containing 45-like, partial [Paramuricea clavata]
MAESLRYKFEEHLTCSVCLEPFKDPKVLPCLHSYCHVCIVNLTKNANSNTINCPECRLAVEVDEKTVSTLPSNFFVNNLLATMTLTNDQPSAKKILCENCDSEDAAQNRCNECGMFLCQYCTEFHKRSRSTKHHELVTMEQLKSNPVPQNIAEKIRCPKHKQKVIKLFCKTCQTTICRDCTIVDHRQHEYGFVEEVAVEEKRHLQSNLNEVKQRKGRVVEGIVNLKKFNASVEAKKTSTVSEISQHFDQLVKAVESRKREMMEKTTSITNSKQKQIHAQLEVLEVALASCESSIEFTEQAFKNGNDVQILSMEKYILQSLEQVKAVKDQTKPCVILKTCCTSSFQETEAIFNAGKPYSVTLVCHDKNNRRLRYGGQDIKPSFTGMEGGMLKFDVSINGTPAPNCSLTKQVNSPDGVEHLTCSVCLEPFKDPKVLPCLHSYCHVCIVKLAKNAKSKTINCPECRLAVKISGFCVDENVLPSNFFVNNLLATMALTNDKPSAKKIVCDNCDSEDAAQSRCNECGIFLCQYCTEFHKRSRPTKHHELVTMEQLKSNPGPQNIAEKIRCPKHKEEVIKLFCKTCQTTICRDCTIVDHQGHKYGFVEEVAVEEKRHLQSNLNEVKQRKGRVARGIVNLKKFNESLEAKKKSTISEISRHFDQLVKAVESRKREIMEKATSITNSKQKQFHAQLEVLEVALASCESSIEFTEQAFKNGNDVQILSMEKYILQSLEQLKAVKDQTKPCVTEDMVFIIPSSVQETKKKLLTKYDVDVAVANPAYCHTSFKEEGEAFDAGKRHSVTLVCHDKSNRRLRYGGWHVEVQRAITNGGRTMNGRHGEYCSRLRKPQIRQLFDTAQCRPLLTFGGQPAIMYQIESLLRGIKMNNNGVGKKASNIASRVILHIGSGNFGTSRAQSRKVGQISFRPPNFFLPNQHIQKIGLAIRKITAIIRCHTTTPDIFSVYSLNSTNFFYVFMRSPAVAEYVAILKTARDRKIAKIYSNKESYMFTLQANAWSQSGDTQKEHGNSEEHEIHHSSWPMMVRIGSFQKTSIPPPRRKLEQKFPSWGEWFVFKINKKSRYISIWEERSDRIMEMFLSEQT